MITEVRIEKRIKGLAVMNRTKAPHMLQLTLPKDDAPNTLILAPNSHFFMFDKSVYAFGIAENGELILITDEQIKTGEGQHMAKDCFGQEILSW